MDFPLQSTREEGLSSLVEVVVEVPKWSFVKRSQNGIIDFVSPVPCPFNYGSVPIIPAPDGIPIFLLLLGPCSHSPPVAGLEEMICLDFLAVLLNLPVVSMLFGQEIHWMQLY